MAAAAVGARLHPATTRADVPVVPPVAQDRPTMPVHPALRRALRGTAAAAAAAVLAVTAACGGGAPTESTPPPSPPPPSGITVSRVTVTPGTAAVAVGASTALSASATDIAGGQVTSVPITWESLDPDLATVSGSGVVTGVAPGTARVRAGASNRADTAEVTVTGTPAPVVAAVVASPALLVLDLGATQQLAVQARAADGAVLSDVAVTWTSLDPGVAGVSGGGIVSALAVGAARIVATARGVADTVSVTVEPLSLAPATPASVATVVVAPGAVVLNIGATAALAATPFDSVGRRLVGRGVAWTSANGNVASVSASGVVTAGMAGQTTVTATIEGRTASATVTVRPPPVTSVIVTPDGGTVAVGSALQLAALPRSATGETLVGRTATWTSLHPGVATVTAAGQVTGIAAGTASIRATVEGVSRTVSVRVVATAPQPAALTVAPAAVELQTGGVQPLQASVRDASGNALGGYTIAWRTADAAVATVSPSGVVTAVGAGTTTITATAAGRTATAAVTVTAVRTTSNLPALGIGTVVGLMDTTAALPGVLVAGDDDAGGLAPMQAIAVYSLVGIPANATVESATLPVTVDADGVFGDPWSLGALYVERAASVALNVAMLGADAVLVAEAAQPATTLDVAALVRTALASGNDSMIFRFRFPAGSNDNGQTDQVELSVGNLTIVWTR